MPIIHDIKTQHKKHNSYDSNIPNFLNTENKTNMSTNEYRTSNNL